MNDDVKRSYSFNFPKLGWYFGNLDRNSARSQRCGRHLNVLTLQVKNTVSQCKNKIKYYLCNLN